MNRIVKGKMNRIVKGKMKNVRRGKVDRLSKFLWKNVITHAISLRATHFFFQKQLLQAVLFSFGYQIECCIQHNNFPFTRIHSVLDTSKTNMSFLLA